MHLGSPFAFSPSCIYGSSGTLIGVIRDRYIRHPAGPPQFLKVRINCHKDVPGLPIPLQARV